MATFSPPDGINFCCVGVLPSAELSSILSKVVGYLKRVDPHARLRQYDDWWQHDGLHFYKRDLDFGGLFDIVKTPADLIEAIQGDTYVRVGIAPMDCKWYLRFYVDAHDPEATLEGDFDLTLPDEMASGFREGVARELGCTLQQEDAWSYYRRLPPRTGRSRYLGL